MMRDDFLLIIPVRDLLYKINSMACDTLIQKGFLIISILSLVNPIPRIYYLSLFFRKLVNWKLSKRIMSHNYLSTYSINGIVQNIPTRSTKSNFFKIYSDIIIPSMLRSSLRSQSCRFIIKN